MKWYFLIILFSFSNLFAEEVNLFTTRHYESDIRVYKKFTEQTGIRVNIVSGKSKPLEKRILEEGKDCIGDIFFLADVGRLISAEKKNIFQKISSSNIESKVSKSFRSEYWVGIAKRARIIFYSPSTTSKKELDGLNYENLSESKWKGQIAIRQANNVYNQSLISSLIEKNGLEYMEKWLKDFVNNFSRKPQGNDRAQILSVASGESKLAIANTYYYALMLSGKKGKEQQLAAQKVKPFFPNQDNRGVHMNISGVGVLKYSPNKKNAIKLIEYLLTPSVQSHIVNNTFEYPIIQKIESNKLVKSMGKFKQDLETPVSRYGKWQKEAYKLMKKSGWN
ncbi:MAG: Fe(3+) ABC transporter substrate-binding protein [Rickettsiales bacterium]|nr:Fe(3+) ABC transporter substrate-binding protein [Rickettsiales bacterium]